MSNKPTKILPLYLHLVQAWEHLSRLNKAAPDRSRHEILTKVREQQESRIESCLEQMPYGSGFDNGVTITPVWHGTQESKVTCMFVEAPFHPMNEHGYYEEWITCRFRVEPCFDGIDLFETIHVGAYQDHVEYIAETIYQALTEECLFPTA